MITKPRAFIYRLNRLKDEAVMLDSSKVISIEIDSDLNKRCVIVKSSDSSVFDGNNNAVTYSFITCMNYRGPFIDRFWRMYMQNVNSVMPSTWKEKRSEICRNHNLLQYTEGDYEITTNRCFIDMVIARKYVDSYGIYTFEFIPVVQYIFSKTPLIPDDSDAELKAYSDASGITVNQIKQDIWRKFGYRYSGFTPSGEQAEELTLNDIQVHIKMMLQRFLRQYGITNVEPIQKFNAVSKFRKITYVSGTSLGGLVENLRKKYFLRIYQEYPNSDSEASKAKSFHNYMLNYLVMTTEPPLTEYPANQLGSLPFPSEYDLENGTVNWNDYGVNLKNDTVYISYSEVIKKFGTSKVHHLYDLFTGISCQDNTNKRNNALFMSSSVRLVSGIDLKLKAIVEFKKFGDTKTYDVYLQSSLVNNSQIQVAYGTKYTLRKYVDGVMSELPLVAGEFQQHMFPMPSSTIISPMASPYDKVTDVNANVILDWISKSISNFCDTIKCQGGSAYKMEMEFATPLFQNSPASLVYVAQLYPYNTNGTSRRDADGVLYIASVDRIRETIDSNGYVFNVHCSTGQKIEDIKF